MLNPKTKERELAYVVRIDGILPIEGADRVEQALVGGWRVMVQKGQFKPNDYAVYFEIDSKLPEQEPYMFLQSKHFKIKTQKYFKGTVISQGLLMSFQDFQDEDGKVPTWLAKFNQLVTQDKIEIPYFLTKELKVTYAVAEDNKRKANINKYDKMYQRHLSLFKKYKILRKIYSVPIGKKFLFIFLGKKKDNRLWPNWVAKTDEERIQNMPWLFDGAYVDKKWIATEKIDGTSTTFTIKRGLFKNDFYVCSRNVVFDKPEKTCYYEENVYLKMADKYNVESKLQYMLETNPSLNFITLQGETYGKTIQKREYELEDQDFAAFNLIFGYKNGQTKRYNPEEMTEILSKYDIPCVPIVAKDISILPTCDDMLNFATGVSAIDGGDREGLVWRSYDGVESFKCVSNDFIIKYHGGD